MTTDPGDDTFITKNITNNDIYDLMTSIKKETSEIKEQALITNGRVTANEKQIKGIAKSGLAVGSAVVSAFTIVIFWIANHMQFK
jgi:hypothetical protein